MTEFRKYIPVLFGGEGEKQPTYGDITPAADLWVRGYYYGVTNQGEIKYFSSNSYSNSPNIRGNAGDKLNLKNNPTGTVDICCFTAEQKDPTVDLPFSRIRVSTANSANYDYILPEGTKYFTLTKTYSQISAMTATLTKGE